jgi:hypothetical protein
MKIDMKKGYFHTADMEAIQAALATLERLCNKNEEKDESSSLKVYTNKEMLSLLGVSEKQLRQYRNEGRLSYSRVDDKFWYTQDDVEEFLLKHHHEAFAS